MHLKGGYRLCVHSCSVSWVGQQKLTGRLIDSWNVGLYVISDFTQIRRNLYTCITTGPTHEGTINRYMRPRGVIIVLLPVARWFTSVVNHNDVKKAINGPSYY